MVEGHHVPRAHRLRLLPEQRVRLRRRDREAAAAGGAREGDVDAHVPQRAEPHPLAPRLARHERAGARRHLDVLVRVPRARADPRPVRARHRVPHAHAVLPGRRPGRGHPARLLSRGAEVLRLDAARDRRLRDAAVAKRDLARAHRGARPAVCGGRDRPRAVRACAARLGRRLGPAQERAVPRLPPGRLPRAGVPRRRRVCALPRPHGGDARVRAHRRAVPRPARADGRRALDRGRPQGRPAAATRAAHVDGVADPPFQARDRSCSPPSTSTPARPAITGSPASPPPRRPKKS